MFRGLARTDLKVTLKLKDFFFDRARVSGAIEKSRYRPMYRCAGMIRVTARRSMRKRKKASPPGKPPHRHSPESNLQTIWFAWDPRIDGIVAGPIGFNAQEGAVPGLHEHGGVRDVVEHLAAWGSAGVPHWTTASVRKATVVLDRRVRRIRYKPRPFMRPALEKVATKYPDLWHQAIRG